MRVAVLTNDELSPRINWSTLGPPLTGALSTIKGFDRYSPLPLNSFNGVKHDLSLRRSVSGYEAVFWMQLSLRPEKEVSGTNIFAQGVHRFAYIIDAWPYVLPRAGRALTIQGVDTCFVAFRQGFDQLKARFPDRDFIHLPFGYDDDVFVPAEQDQDVFAFSMGRRHEPIHEALQEYCTRRGLKYVSSTGGAVRDPSVLGEMVARSKYFVVTPPDLDHPERAGGFSPFVMRYLEGAGAGSRLLGVRPTSGEFEDMLPGDSILDVLPDGTDLAARLDEDMVMAPSRERQLDIAAEVRRRHSWKRRASTIALAIEERVS